MLFNSSDTQSSPLTVFKTAQEAHHLNNILSSKCCATCSDLVHPVMIHNYSCQKFNNHKYSILWNLDFVQIANKTLMETTCHCIPFWGKKLLYFVFLKKKTWQCKLIKSSMNENFIKAVFLFQVLLRSIKFCRQFSIRKWHLN